MITGWVISTTREDMTVCGVPVVISDYRVAFYFFAGCMACCFITCLFFKFQVNIGKFQVNVCKLQVNVCKLHR